MRDRGEKNCIKPADNSKTLVEKHFTGGSIVF